MMKRMIPLVLLVGFLPMMAFAQRGPSPERMKARVEQQVQDLTKVLALSDKQSVGVKEILLAQVDKRMKLFNDRTGDRQARFEKMQALQKETDDSIIALLDEGQVEKYKAHVEKQREQRGRRQGRRWGGS